MTNETIAGRIVDLVKGLFGPRPSEDQKAEPKDDASASTSSDKPKTSAEDTPAETDSPADSGTDTETETDSSDSATAESGESANEETSGADTEQAPLVAEEDKDSIAEELNTGEAKTVTASRETLDRAVSAANKSELPVPNYSTVTLPSMRARLRKLSLDDVRTMRAYEAANEDRADFLKMFDNRIAKLENEN